MNTMNDVSLQQSAAAMSIVVAAILWMGKIFRSSCKDPVASSSTSKSAPTTNALAKETPFDKLADVYDSSFCDN